MLLHFCEPDSNATSDKSGTKFKDQYGPITNDIFPDHCQPMKAKLEARVDAMRSVFPEFELMLECVWLPNGFGPDAVLWALKRYDIQTGQLSMGVPGLHFGFWLKEMHGVRILNLESNIRVVENSWEKMHETCKSQTFHTEEIGEQVVLKGV